jgi:His-Xaa-Ser system radical SAM maturase HxsC
MGRYVTLPLHGIASVVRGVSASEPSSLIRLRSQLSAKFNPGTDFLLVGSQEEVLTAAQSRPQGVMIISDEPLESALGSTGPNRLVRIPEKFGYLSDGDIIAINYESRRFRTLYRRASRHNSFLVTDRCNHYCLMCSQPPKDIDDRWILDEIKAAVPLIDKEAPTLGFTGGEPLLDWPGFVDVLAVCRDELPKTAIHVLSNGRAFVRDEVVAAWAGIQHPSLTVGIPIYASIDHIHDYIVQARGAFDETMLGVLKMKDRAQRVEIRVVLHALTAPRIEETCRWLGRNLPFVDHVALMGLENTGFAIANADELWIDPIDYKSELANAVDLLVSAKVNVSVYNLPRCVLDRSVWPYAAQSISDWKNGYYEECERCIEKDRCSGFFTSGRPRRSRGIEPILRDSPASAGISSECLSGVL